MAAARGPRGGACAGRAASVIHIAPAGRAASGVRARPPADCAAFAASATLLSGGLA
jgi:hypothetical protein